MQRRETTVCCGYFHQATVAHHHPPLSAGGSLRDSTSGTVDKITFITLNRNLYCFRAHVSSWGPQLQLFLWRLLNSHALFPLGPQLIINTNIHSSNMRSFQASAALITPPHPHPPPIYFKTWNHHFDVVTFQTMLSEMSNLSWTHVQGRKESGRDSLSSFY